MTRSKKDDIVAITKRVVDGLQNVVAGLGTSRDKSRYTTYGDVVPLTHVELGNIYRSSWLGKRIVNAVADDMVRGWRTWQFAQDDAENENAAGQLEKALGVRQKVREALRWARLYGGAIVIMGIDNQPLSEPLDYNTVKRGSLKWLAVKDRWWLGYGGATHQQVSIGDESVMFDGTRTVDLASPNFGKPEVFTLAESGQSVHWTRTLRFDGEELPYLQFLKNRMWGDSVLQHTISSIRNTDTISAAIASLVFESNVDVLSVEGLADLLTQKDGERKLLARFQTAAMLKSINRLFLLDSREKYEKKGASFTGLDKVWAQFQMDVSGAADIPIMRLFGQSAAGLNATGDNDIRNYYDAVLVRCENDLRPQLERLDQVLLRSALGYFPEDYRFSFNSLWQMSDAEKATLQKDRAARDQAYVSMGVVTEGLVARELKENATYVSMTEEDVDAAEELAEALPSPKETPPQNELPSQGVEPKTSAPTK